MILRLGYAVTSGCYFKQGELWLASSAPGAQDTYGYVLVHRLLGNNRKLDVRKIVSGKQQGEYFGAAVTSCDLNGDGKDELIVGAPQWAKDMDEGRIYIFTASHTVCTICNISIQRISVVSYMAA